MSAPITGPIAGALQAVMDLFSGAGVEPPDLGASLREAAARRARVGLATGAGPGVPASGGPVPPGIPRGAMPSPPPMGLSPAAPAPAAVPSAAPSSVTSTVARALQALKDAGKGFGGFGGGAHVPPPLLTGPATPGAGPLLTGPAGGVPTAVETEAVLAANPLKNAAPGVAAKIGARGLLGALGTGISTYMAGKEVGDEAAAHAAATGEDLASGILKRQLMSLADPMGMIGGAGRAVDFVSGFTGSPTDTTPTYSANNGLGQLGNALAALGHWSGLGQRDVTSLSPGAQMSQQDLMALVQARLGAANSLLGADPTQRANATDAQRAQYTDAVNNLSTQLLRQGFTPMQISSLMRRQANTDQHWVGEDNFGY